MVKNSKKVSRKVDKWSIELFLVKSGRKCLKIVCIKRQKNWDCVHMVYECPSAEAWVGNGKCDDETNIPECDYDGGDCCMDPYVQGFCTICVCYDE